MNLQKFLTYSPAIALVLLGLLIVALFQNQPGLSISLANFGVGSGDVSAGGDSISVGWFFVLAGGVMYVLTWRKEVKAPSVPPTTNARSLSNVTDIVEFSNKMQRATISALIALVLVIITFGLAILI